MKNALILLSLFVLYNPNLSAITGKKNNTYSQDLEKSEALCAATGCVTAGTLTGIAALLATGSPYTLLTQIRSKQEQPKDC